MKVVGPHVALAREEASFERLAVGIIAGGPIQFSSKPTAVVRIIAVVVGSTNVSRRIHEPTRWNLSGVLLHITINT